MGAGVSAWEARFEAFTVHAFDVARGTPHRGVVVGGGIEPHQLHAWDRLTGKLRPVTDAPNGMTGGAISADGAWVLWVDDPDAREEGVLVKAPFAGGPPEPVDPSLPAASILDLVTYADQVAFSVVIEGRVEHRIATLDRPGSRIVATDEGTAWVSAFADSGGALLVARFRADGTREAVVRDVASGAQTAILAETDASMRAYLPSPVPGDPRVVAETDASGVQRPLLWDRASGDRRPLPVGDLEGDVRPVAWSPDGITVLLVQIHRAELRFHLLDLASGRLRPLATPGGVVTALPDTFATVFASADEILTLWQSGSHPRSLLSITVTTGAPRVVVGDQAPPPGRAWRHVEFASADGTPLQAWMAVPDGVPPFPAVIDVHGGPGAVQFDEYLPHLAAFVDQGFVVLTLNYRSSITFGTAFQRAPMGRLGELETEDIAAAREHLVRTGLADPRRMLIEGWSYGGYLTLMTLGRQPDDWAGGICGVGIGDLVAEHAEAVPMIRDMFTAWMMGTPEELPERYAAASPITYSDRVAAPLLVIHGTDDIRCPPGQMRRYLERMAELGKTVDAEWFAAGHTGGLANPSLFREHTRRMLEFALDATGRQVRA